MAAIGPTEVAMAAAGGAMLLDVMRMDAWLTNVLLKNAELIDAEMVGPRQRNENTHAIHPFKSTGRWADE